MTDIPFNALVAITSLVYALGLFSDNLIGKQWSSALKQVKTWMIGIVGVIFLCHIQFTEKTSIEGIGVHQLSGWSQLLIGLTFASVANTLFHIGQRFDQTGSGDTPDIPVSSAPPKLVRNHKKTAKNAA